MESRLSVRFQSELLTKYDLDWGLVAQGVSVFES